MEGRGRGDPRHDDARPRHLPDHRSSRHPRAGVLWPTRLRRQRLRRRRAVLAVSWPPRARGIRRSLGLRRRAARRASRGQARRRPPAQNRVGPRHPRRVALRPPRERGPDDQADVQRSGVSEAARRVRAAARPGSGVLRLRAAETAAARPGAALARQRDAVHWRIAGRPAASASAGAPRAGFPVGRRPAPSHGRGRAHDIGRERARPAGRFDRTVGVRRGGRSRRTGVRRARLSGQRHTGGRTRDSLQRGGRRRSRPRHADRRPAGGGLSHESGRAGRARIDLAQRVGMARCRRPHRGADRNRVLPLGERLGPRDEARNAPPGRRRGYRRRRGRDARARRARHHRREERADVGPAISAGPSPHPPGRRGVLGSVSRDAEGVRDARRRPGPVAKPIRAADVGAGGAHGADAGRVAPAPGSTPRRRGSPSQRSVATASTRRAARSTWAPTSSTSASS